jgi:hypothetical protein
MASATTLRGSMSSSRTTTALWHTSTTAASVVARSMGMVAGFNSCIGGGACMSEELGKRPATEWSQDGRAPSKNLGMRENKDEKALRPPSPLFQARLQTLLERPQCHSVPLSQDGKEI